MKNLWKHKNYCSKKQLMKNIKIITEIGKIIRIKKEMKWKTVKVAKKKTTTLLGSQQISLRGAIREQHFVLNPQTILKIEANKRKNFIH